jgi:hypothetical protein
MRAVLAVLVPTSMLFTGAFFACGGTTLQDNHDASTTDAGMDADAPEIGFEAPAVEDAATVSCSIMSDMMGVTTIDPVAYCIERMVIENQHQYGFKASTGTYASWNYNTLLHGEGDGGAVVHSVLDDISYASSLVDYYQWSQMYADDSSFNGDSKGDSGTATSDILAMTTLIEKELATLPLDYDGETYFNLRNLSTGLKFLTDNDDAAKIDAIALAYGEQIYSTFYFDLPLAGTMDGGKPDSAGGTDAGSDPGAMGDGIIGVNQEPSTGTPGILYQPDKVTSAAYALLDLAYNNGTLADVDKWVTAARRALDHINQKARDPASGLYLGSLVTTGSSIDTLGNLTTPADLISSGVQATIALYLLRAQADVAMTEVLDAGVGDHDVEVPLDAALIGPLAPMGNFPFQSRADAIIAGMDLLWDGASTGDGGLDAATTGRLGYMDGIVASTRAVIQTKSIRPNAYMFGALWRQDVLEGSAFTRVDKHNALRNLLVDQTPGQPIIMAGANDSFINVVINQGGYFDTVTQGFQLLPTSTSATAQNYTAAAAAAAIAGFQEQLWHYVMPP